MDQLNKNNELFNNDNLGQKIKPVEVPSKNIGIDIDNQFMENIADAGTDGKLDLSVIESFTNISRSRDSVYELIDMMMSDSTMASVLETYAEDTTEYNDGGRIVWIESDNPNVTKYLEYLIDTMNIDKNIYSWAHCLIKYGDVYIKLFRKSDEDKADFNFHTNDDKSLLNEGVIAKVHNDEDHYTGYVEMIKNPAEVFELTKLGKTRGYIKTNISTFSTNNAGTSQQMLLNNTNFMNIYKFNEKDVELYAADDFVHGFLQDNDTREDERVNIFCSTGKYNTDGTEESIDHSFSVRRGQSLFYTAFKSWRELSLIKNAILLNRVTKSAIVRAIQVEVGDMPKEMVGPHMQGIKNLIEQKSAINAGRTISEYTNPGPIENNIYVPTHDGVGAITIESVGGDVDMGQLTDLDNATNTLFGALRVPKQYFGLTDDAAGFNGGSSLSLISSRYAKTIKRIQNSLIQMLTDLFNLVLIDRGFESYVNEFTVKMQAPTTQEEIDRRENEASKVNMISDIMSLVDGIEDSIKKLEILKILLSNVITDSEVLQLIQDEIDSLTEELNNTDEDQISEEDTFEFGGGDESEEEDIFSDIGGESSMPEADMSLPTPAETGAEESFETNEDKDVLIEQTDDDNLPTPEELGLDLVY